MGVYAVPADAVTDETDGNGREIGAGQLPSGAELLGTAAAGERTSEQRRGADPAGAEPAGAQHEEGVSLQRALPAAGQTDDRSSRGQLARQPAPLGPADAGLLHRPAARQGHPQVSRLSSQALLGRCHLRRRQIRPLRRKGSPHLISLLLLFDLYQFDLYSLIRIHQIIIIN